MNTKGLYWNASIIHPALYNNTPNQSASPRLVFLHFRSTREKE